jgi:hypothetical protein
MADPKKSLSQEDLAVTFRQGVELGHPQTRKRSDQARRNQQPTGGAMPSMVSLSEAAGKLESAQDGIQGNADNMEHHGQGRSEEAGVVGGNFGATG